MIDTDQFPFVKELESRWRYIRNDYRNVQQSFINNEAIEINPDGKWHLFPICSYPEGENEIGARYVSFTHQLIKRFVPDHRAAIFSRLSANSVIPAHKGSQDGDWLRLHLGIDVPHGDLGIQVEDETYRWENGKAFIIDDKKMHHAWNSTTQDRVVLIVDFKQ